MSVFNDQLDLEVLKYALDHHAFQIPREELDVLLQLMHNWKQQQPGAAQQICQFAAQSESIDRAYDHALLDLRRQYTSQHRAKGAILIPQTHGELNGLTQIADQLIVSLQTILTPPQPPPKTTLWDNFDRIAIMTAGGAFLGGAIVQLFGGGATQFIGAAVGGLVGLLSGYYVNQPITRPSGRKSS
jgi:hypothetical protein